MSKEYKNIPKNVTSDRLRIIYHNGTSFDLLGNYRDIADFLHWHPRFAKADCPDKVIRVPKYAYHLSDGVINNE